MRKQERCRPLELQKRETIDKMPMRCLVSFLLPIISFCRPALFKEKREPSVSSFLPRRPYFLPERAVLFYIQHILPSSFPFYDACLPPSSSRMPAQPAFLLFSLSFITVVHVREQRFVFSWQAAAAVLLPNRVPRRGKWSFRCLTRRR